MPGSDPKHVLVRLRKEIGATEARLSVGISAVATSVRIEPHFSKEYTKAGSTLHRKPEDGTPNGPTTDLRTTCEAAVVCAVLHFQELCARPFDFSIQVIEGENLPEDYTVGFYVAATRAAVRATGFSSGVENDSYGWEEIG